MARYQRGNLTLRKRAHGPDAWQFRYVIDGRACSELLGNTDALPTRGDAERAAEHVRLRINSSHPSVSHSLTVRGLVDRYLTEYAARHVRPHSLQVYRSLLTTHVLPKWGNVLLRDVRPMALDDWLQSYDASTQVRAHVKGLLHHVFKLAQRWELLDRNPVDLIGPVTSKRLKVPRRLTPPEVRAVAEQLPEPIRTMWLTCACTGLRSCELVALQWGDVDFELLTLKVQRSCVQGQINDCKTEASAATLPLSPALKELLKAHRGRSRRILSTDYIFGNDSGQTRWQSEIVKNYIRPAAQRAGVLGKVGWHSLRHGLSTLLRAQGVDVKVQQSLLRHSTIQMTLDGYTGVATDQQRQAVNAASDELLQSVLPCTRAIQ